MIETSKGTYISSVDWIAYFAMNDELIFVQQAVCERINNLASNHRAHGLSVEGEAEVRARLALESHLRPPESEQVGHGRVESMSESSK
jgi:hypothetical protein